MDAITEKLFPILATQLPACPPACIPLKCFHLPRPLWKMRYGEWQLDNSAGGEKCHVAIAWHASKFGRAKVNSRFSAAAWIFFSAFGCRLRSTETAPTTRKKNPLDDGERTDTSSRVSALHAKRIRSLLLLLENTCRLLSTRPSVRWRDRNKRGNVTEEEERVGPPACFR